MASALLFCWCVCLSSSAVYAVFTPIYEDTGISFNNLNAGTGYMFLLFGWALLFWQPLALTYGRRPVYLLCLVGTVCMNVWAGYAKSKDTWVGSRILIGVFGAPSEALVEITVADLFFTHQRATYMSVYIIFLFGGQWANIPAGFITDSMGWEWVLFWAAIVNAIGFVVLFFTMEETLYYRTPIIPSRELATTEGSLEGESGVVCDVREKSQFQAQRGLANGSVAAASSYPPPKSYWQKLALYTPLNGRPNHFLKIAFRPFPILQFPIVLFSGFIYGLYLSWFALLNGTVSIFLSSAPYDFAASIVGLTYVAQLIGLYISVPLGGKLGDLLTIYLARRNKGVMEPEFRLWLFTIPLIVGPVGLIVWGVGYAHQIHWIGLLFGMGFSGLVSGLSGTLCCTYVVDSYRELSGECLITMVLIRNTVCAGSPNAYFEKILTLFS